MTEKRYRKPSEFPAGTFDFKKLREGNCLYIDKTALMYELAQLSFVFLSRPRRFGKSLLCSTLKAYFEGRKELFEACPEQGRRGLDIMNLEKDWVEYPVFHFSISALKDKVVERMEDELNYQLNQYEEIYGRDMGATTPGMRLKSIIKKAYAKTGKRVVVIVDEYDAPMLSYLHDESKLTEVRQIMQEFYQTLKECDAEERFVFITGITKFSQLSIFSTINNLTNISLDKKYSAICGFTETELHEAFDTDMELLAEEYKVSKEEVKVEIKRRYDGYHFCHTSEDIYNPYSIMKTFAQREMRSYWFESGTPTFILDEVRKNGTDILKLEGSKARETEFDQPTESISSILPLMYQAGYITIKGFNPISRVYTLGMPNAEVKAGLMENILPILNGTSLTSNSNYATQIIDCLANGDYDKMMEWLQAFLLSVPYMQQGKDLLKDIAVLEALYQRDLYLFFSGMAAQVQVEPMMSDGRVDMVMHLGDCIFIFEFKVSASAKSALGQIDKNRYAEPWRPVQRKLIKCGVRFDVVKRTLKDWKFEEVK